MGLLNEKMIESIPVIRCQTALKAALVLLQHRARKRDLSEYVREVLIGHCKQELGDDTFGDDSAFGNLEDAPQGTTRLSGVR